MSADVIPFPTDLEADLEAWADGEPSGRFMPPPPMKEDNRVDILLDELANHQEYRPKAHDALDCVRCRLSAWLAGEGQYPADNLAHSRKPQVRSYQSHGWRT